MSRTPWLSIAALALALPAADARALDRDRPFHDFVRDQWGVAEGLPQVSVLSITQDDGGYIWVGTQNGIARFDGARFVPIPSSSLGAHSVTQVVDALRDRQGVLWFAHERGVVRIEGGDARVISDPSASALAYDVLEVPDGRILVATARGLFEASDDALWPLALEGTPLHAAAVHHDGSIWLGGRGEVIRLLGSEVRRIALPTRPGTIVNALVATPEALWIGTSTGMFKIGLAASEPDGIVVPEPTEIDTPVDSLLRDAGGTLWIGTPGALWRWRPDGRLDRHGEDEFIRRAWVSALFEDRDGHLWLGTLNDSLFRLADGWVTRIGEDSGLRDVLVWSVTHAPDGRLVVGTNSDVMAIADGRATLLVDGAELPNPTAYELAYDALGRLWIGTRGGLARLDVPGAAPVPIGEVGSAQVNAVVPGDGDHAWIGTSEGIFRWRDGAVQRMAPLTHGPTDRVRGVLPLGDERALLATEGGVRAIDDGGVSTPGWARALDGVFVTAIDRLLPDLAIVTTVGKGFGVLIGDELRMVEHEPELAALSTWGSRIVDRHVYIAAAEGVVSLPVDGLRAWWSEPTTTLDWRVPASVAGTLRGSQRARCCNGGARSRIAVDGRLIWLPTSDGVIGLDLDDLERGAETPVVHIESARHGGKVVRMPSNGDALTLDAVDRDLAVRFTAIAHRDPKGLRFAYRLDGFDREWVAAGERREAFYTNLPPGDFTFRVRAESAARIGSPQDATLPVHVPPRWHEREATRLGLLAAALAIAFLIARYAMSWRERAFAAREARLRRDVDERTAELAHANAQLRAANRALAQESETDPLTGLPNRRWLVGHLGDWLRNGPGAEAGDSCTVLAMFDLDRFQELNTRHGRTAGDELLRGFGALLRHLAGPEGMVVRWGGEDFLLLQRGVPRAEASARVSALWRSAQEHMHPAPDGSPILLPCSVGYSVWPPARAAVGVAWSTALEMADAAAWRVRAESRKGFGGLLLSEGADPALLAGGIAGRVDALLRGGVLLWERLDGPPRAPN